MNLNAVAKSRDSYMRDYTKWKENQVTTAECLKMIDLVGKLVDAQYELIRAKDAMIVCYQVSSPITDGILDNLQTSGDLVDQLRAQIDALPTS